MATTFVDVLLQLRDELGADVLSGGKIETFEAGTTTPLATYQDLAGAVANTNPVVLDSAGMAIIRQTDGVAYKWVVSDADDNELWTRDNITVGTSADGASLSYQVAMTYLGTPSAQGYMGGHVFLDSVTFPVDFEGADGEVETNPGSDFVISIRRDNTEVGTATISTTGAYTFTSTGGVAVAFTAGQKLTFIGPDAVGAAADFCMTLEGTVQ